MSLTCFPHLKSLSWRGITRGDHFWSLGEFISKNTTGVESLRILTLDLVYWWTAKESWYDYERATLGGFPPRPDNFFARRVLRSHPNEEPPRVQVTEQPFPVCSLVRICGGRDDPSL